MKIYIMRHGIAEDESPSGQDFDRALTASGRERTARVAHELLRKEEAPRVILSSPLVRALQTAELVAYVCKPEEPVRVRREIAPGGDLRGLVIELIRAGQKKVMLVGHEPDLSTLVAGLVPEGFSHAFDKSMVVGLRCEEGKPIERRFILEPRGLTWM